MKDLSKNTSTLLEQDSTILDVLYRAGIGILEL